MSRIASDPTAAHPPLRVMLGITVALAIAFACITASYYLFGSDSARYVELGRSLARGEGYFYFGAPERAFPPGFPALLALANLLLGESFATSARWAALISALVFPAAWAFARTRTAALPIALLTVSSVGFLEIVIGNPRSEPIYMVGSLGLLAWAYWGAMRPESSRPSAPYIAAGTMLLLITVATRSIGIAAVGAVAMVLLERIVRPVPGARRFPPEIAIPLGAGVVFLVLWFAWTRSNANLESATGAGGSYVRHLLLLDPHRPELGGVSPLALLIRVLRNLVVQLGHAAELLTQLPWIKPRWFSPFTATMAALTVAGVVNELRRPTRLGAWYVLGYGVILLLWPYDEGTRFLVPILPLLWVFALVGARRATAALSAGSRPFRLGLIAAGCVSVLGALVSLRSAPDDFSRQDQAFVMAWLVVLGIAVFGWPKAQAWTGAAPSRFGRPVLIGALVLYAAAGAAQVAPSVAAQFRGSSLTDPVTAALQEASRWINGNAPPEATTQASFPAPLLFATRRKTVKFPATSSPEQLRESIETHRPDFLVVLNDSDNPYYQPVDSEKFGIVQKLFPGAWREVARLKGSTIYAFR